MSNTIEQPDNEWLTPQEAADYLKVKRQTLVRWAKEGKVPKYHMPPRFTRYKRTDLDAFLEQFRTQAA